jgi:uncharacterized protein YdhG (YjbR/CyaY superfamily)
MKKAKSGKRPSATRHAGALRTPATKPRAAKKASPKRALKTVAPQTVDEYLAAVPELARGSIDKIREAIRSVVPADTTEVISYGIPAFKHKKVLVWYAAFANHCSLFPTASVIEAFKGELKGFSASKGTVHFPLKKPMPIELIKKMVRARVAQNESGKSR